MKKSLLAIFFILVMTGCISARKNILEREGDTWSYSVREMVKKGEISIGMTKTQVAAATDQEIRYIPKSISETRNGTLEIWTLYKFGSLWTKTRGPYDQRVDIHFDYNGRVDSIYR